jgi:hypothetical protein
METKETSKSEMLPEDRSFYEGLGACTALSLAIVLVASL